MFSHTNEHLELLSKYILFWTFVSFIWQKKEQMDVMNLQTNRRNSGRETFPKTLRCVMSRPLKPTTHHISSYRRHRKSEIITVHLSDVTTVHLVRWATTLWHSYINGGVKKKKNQSNSWILEFVFGRNRIIKANKMSSGYLCVVKVSSVRNWWRIWIFSGVEHVTSKLLLPWLENWSDQNEIVFILLKYFPFLCGYNKPVKAASTKVWK